MSVWEYRKPSGERGYTHLTVTVYGTVNVDGSESYAVLRRVPDSMESIARCL